MDDVALPPSYGEFASWWPLWSAPEDYAEEAGTYRRVLEDAASARVRTVLELGCGGGNNASHLKRRFAMTLTDLSPAMLEVSRRSNPECEHVAGDMRSLRLGRVFDAVLVHDAIAYLTTESDLARAMATARAHLAPGGLALFVPDDTTETWRPATSHGGHDGGGRSLRYLCVAWDEDPADTRVAQAYVFFLREGTEAPQVRLEVHPHGLFPRATWLRLLGDAGFDAEALPYRHSAFAPDAGRVLFLGRAR